MYFARCILFVGILVTRCLTHLGGFFWMGPYVKLIQCAYKICNALQIVLLELSPTGHWEDGVNSLISSISCTKQSNLFALSLKTEKCLYRSFGTIQCSLIKVFANVRGRCSNSSKSHMNGLQRFESTIEQTTEKMLPSHKTTTAAAMKTKRITSSRELLHYR